MTVTGLLLVYIGLNAMAAIPFCLLARRDFERQGRWSAPVAVMSGVLMHGHFLAHLALSWSDRGSLVTPGMISTGSGIALFLCGGWIIAQGRKAYGDTARVYGLKEDQLISSGIYLRTRNPQYVGYALMFLGSAMASGSSWAFGSAALFAAFIHVFITRIEEPQMHRVFGDEFYAYSQRVGRYWSN